MRNGRRKVGKELDILSSMCWTLNNATGDVLWLTTIFACTFSPAIFSVSPVVSTATLQVNTQEEGRVASGYTLKWAGGVFHVRFRMNVLKKGLEVANQLAIIVYSLHTWWKQLRGVCHEVITNFPRDDNIPGDTLEPTQSALSWTETRGHICV